VVIDDILKSKRTELEAEKRKVPLKALEATLGSRRAKAHSFQDALKANDSLSLICELKKASPSEGILRTDFEPVHLASELKKAGASALSVLTERKFFQGSPVHLQQVASEVDLPVLRKDFIIDAYQVYESAVWGAHAFLLIAFLLDQNELKNLIQLGHDLSLDVLVEVHTPEDLDKALSAGAQLVGVNIRNLKTLKIDHDIAPELIRRIPHDKTIVLESGVKTRDDIIQYQNLGVTCFLVGTSLMKADNLTLKVQQLLGKTCAEDR